MTLNLPNAIIRIMNGKEVIDFGKRVVMSTLVLGAAGAVVYDALSNASPTKNGSDNIL